jgi:hypothetical protein
MREMTAQEDLSEFWCWNKECKEYGKKGRGNLGVHDRIGKEEHLLLKCKTCGKTFSEWRGTVFFGLRAPRRKILRALALIPEKGGIRAVVRVTGHSPNSIMKWIRLAAAHAQQVNEYFLHDLNLTQVQIDEIWSFIKKKTRTASLKTLLD